jgi:type I restriction enzyme S subunit
VAKLEKLLSRVDAAQVRIATIPRILKRFRQSVLAAACSGKLTADWREENATDANSRTLIRMLSDKRRALWEERERAKLASDRRTPNDELKKKYKPPFEPNPEDAPELPNTWTPATVSQLALLDVGFAFKSAEYSKAGIRLLRGENVEPGSLRWNDVRFWPESNLNGYEHLLIEEGEIILAMDRPVISTGLKIARAKRSDLPCLLVQRMTRFKMAEEKMTDYLYYNLQLVNFIEHLSSGMTGSDLPHVTGDGLARYTIGLPPLAEQHEIVRRVEALFKTADALEGRYRKAKAHVDKLTQSILAKAFRGELVPQDPNDEPAAALLARIGQERAQSVRSSKRI